MDVIIISCGKTPTLQKLTQNSVNSCVNSLGDFNIIVVENCKHIQYANCKTLYYQPSGYFNYNRALNYGISQCTGEYIACCNNDLVFGREWADNMMNAFYSHDYDSLSPFEPNWHITWKECIAINKFQNDPTYISQGNFAIPGNQVTVFFTGWCYVIKREAYNKIGKFSELVEFWYSDNIVVEQYNKHGIKHALVCNSLVKHIYQQTWTNTEVLCATKQKLYTTGGRQARLFENAKQVLWST